MPCDTNILCGISSRFQLLSPTEGQVAHALLTRPPLSHPSLLTEISSKGASFDLHVLGTPPAFILSQDQTLIKKLSIAQTNHYLNIWLGLFVVSVDSLRIVYINLLFNFQSSLLVSASSFYQSYFFLSTSF